MIDLDEEFARMEGMLERRERMALGVTCNEMIELITRLRQAEKDAARYRWLRDESVLTNKNAPLTFFTDTSGDHISFDFDGSSYSVLHDDRLDRAIDEAIQCK